ncbi:MAG: hypothetical protein ABMA64_38660, partial [Myxococcota bacterium]
WTRAIGAGLAALRLNQHFPPWEAVARWLAVTDDPLWLDPRRGWPIPREWVRIRVERELAAGALADLDAIDRSPDPRGIASRRAHHQRLRDLPPIPVFDVRIALRELRGADASWWVRADRWDVATGTFARYTVTVGDRAVRGSDGELRPATDLGARLETLGAEDASLAFAVLRDREGLRVDEVVRGVLGPAHAPGLAGPLPGVLTGPMVSAALERASVDLTDGRIDDPLVDEVVVPAAGAGFGVARQRKWAVTAADVGPLRAWLTARGSRNLVYTL